MKSDTVNDCDVVLYWVDSTDPRWLEQYTKYNKKKPNRFRDIGILKYVFRSIEFNMPWVRKVHFITNGQIPDWLNVESDKLAFHTHKDIFIFKDALPVFNSSAIEANFSNIPGLSDKFILFNDDMVVLNKIDESRFFVKNKPVDYIKLSYPRKGWLYEKIKPQNALACQFINNAYTFLDDLKIKNIGKDKLYNGRYNLITNVSNFLWSIFDEVKWLDIYHHPQAHTKSTWERFTNKHLNDVIKETSYAKFRRPTDINQYLYRFINLLEGNFYPHQYNDHLSLYVNNIEKCSEDLDNLTAGINFLCICEDENISDKEFEKLKVILSTYFNRIFKLKSSYEK